MPLIFSQHNDNTFQRGNDEQTIYQLTSLATTQLSDVSNETEILSDTVGLDETLYIKEVQVNLTYGDATTSNVVDYILYVDGVPRACGKFPSSGNAVNLLSFANSINTFAVPIPAASGVEVSVVIFHSQLDAPLVNYFVAIRGWTEKKVT